MLRRVETASVDLQAYAGFIDERLAAELGELARRLEGQRVLVINSTPVGGGVAEILRSEVPLLRALGLDVEWQVLEAPESFFRVTKKLHNALQGGPMGLGEEEWATYAGVVKEAASGLDAAEWDRIVVHDPQPCALRTFADASERTRWVWRCHLDTEAPNPGVLARLRRHSDAYDASIFTLREYAFSGARRAHVVPPAIDPLSEKNRPLAPETANEIVQGFDIDTERPLVTQVSRFDPWKDPEGVLDAWKAARREVPGIQLAFVGQAADDDPEASAILTHLTALTEGERDVHVVANRADDRSVRAFQTLSKVVLQKSLREGFGLTVTEALWAGTPVIGGRAGGIPLQIEDGWNGYLVSTVPEAAARLVELLQNPIRADRMGRNGRDHVRRNFLLPRLVRDDLRVLASLDRPEEPLHEPGVASADLADR